jgi:collagen type VII alpha
MYRKPLAAFAAALSVFALAGYAFAHGGGPSSIQATSATFMATTVANSRSDTCAGADGTYTRTRATYSGTATSTDARLNGSMTVHATTLYNATTNLGVVSGRFRVGDTKGGFQAVDTNGSLAGFANGKAKNPRGALLANLSATFDPTTGFADAHLGGGTAPDTAVFVSGRCHDEHGETGASGATGATGATGPTGAAGHHEKHHKHHKHGKHGHKH